MTRFLFATLLLAVPGGLRAAPAAPRPDLLRFENGDQLHGSFQGIKDGLLAVWQRDDLAVPSEFKTAKLHKIILRGARPLKSAASLSHVAMVNGDRLPGTLLALDENTVTVATSFAGVVKLPRKSVSMVAPAPLGSPVRYYGPYSEDGWLMINMAYPDGLPPVTPDARKEEPKPAPDKDQPADKDADQDAKADEAAAADKDANKGEDAADEDGDEAGGSLDPNEIPRWDFSGAAWYWSQKKGSTALVRKEGMADRSLLRFDLAWRNRLMVCVVFHADFKKAPKPEDGEQAADGEAGDEQKRLRAKVELMNRMGMGDTSGLAGLFGNCYVLQINSGYAMLLRCTLDENGNPKMDRLQMNNSGLRLTEMGAASFELRCDRKKGTIALQVNGDRAMEWNETGLDDDPDGYAGKGGGYGFFPQMENSMVRVSDVVVADWNGNPDSARSMQSDDQDMVLLANGTDRFAGKITGLRENKLLLTGRFGEFAFPVQEVAELRFAAKSLTEAPEPATDSIVVRIDPLGRISGKPLTGDARKLRLATPFAGDLDVSLDQAVMLDFEPSTNYLDDWDQPF